MSVQSTLAKVNADLEAGDLEMACQRLRGLLASFPDLLDLRELLAHVYRLRGDRVQAGRWSYLAEQRDAAEVAAFEKATFDPLDRMRALAWFRTPHQAATPVGRKRLAAVLEDARARTHDPGLNYGELQTGRWTPPPRRPLVHRIAVGLLFFGLFLVLNLFLLGVVDGVRVVIGWMS